jgi:uncharacterized protein (TIGR03435 family)
MLRAILIAHLGLLTWVASGQSFEVASVKVSKSIVGHDGQITTDPGRFAARNATLKRLIFEAWQLPYAQIRGGPAWLDTDEFDIEAKAETPANLTELRLMLRTLLVERFKLATRIETKESRIYALLVDKGGPRLPGEKGDSHVSEFHGTLSEFANVLAIKLSIPMVSDPTVISRASGPPIPVVNQTGIQGEYNINLDIKPDPGADSFTVWQRALKEQLGLRLESRKGPVDVLVVEHAERVPSGN